MWQVLDLYEKATGGKVNVSKTEGLACGKLRGEQYDFEREGSVDALVKVEGGRVTLELKVGRGGGIKWCKKGEYVVSLGVPHGWDFHEGDFWRSKYRKAKAPMAHWHDVERMSPHGSALVGNIVSFVTGVTACV